MLRDYAGFESAREIVEDSAVENLSGSQSVISFRPLGWIQWYRWRDFPQHGIRLGADTCSAGIDLAIGEMDMTGRGLGPTVIREFGANYIFLNGDVCAIVADPATSNLRSVRAFKKAGFKIVNTVQLVDEAFERHVVRLDRGELEIPSR
jgi:RimJ/RimL family protein N-acetyltransferase